MPPVIAYLATAIATTVGISVAAATWVSTLIVNAAIMFGAQKLLGKKAQLGDFSADVANRQQMIRQSVASRRIVYGRAKVSGVMVYAKETGTKREFLHMVIVLASHECEGVSAYWVDNEIVPFVGNQPDPTHRLYGYLRINTHLGTAGQTADADLVAECGGEWTTDHKLSGHTYLAVRVKWNEAKFPSGLPVIAATLKGKKVLDPRTAVTAYSDNPALCIYDFMRDAQYGLGVPVGEFNSAAVQAAANVCDEAVGISLYISRQCDYQNGNKLFGMTTQVESQLDGIAPGMRVAGPGIPAGAFITSVQRENGVFYFAIDQDAMANHTNQAVIIGDVENRYSLNGTVDTSTKAGEVLEAMLSAMAGKVVFAGGEWFIHAGAYQTPTVTLTEDDCRGPIQVTTKLSRRELANTIKGTYVSEQDGWVLTDFPPYSPPFYVTQDDGETIVRDIQLPFTISPSMAQRLAKADLERLRQQITTRWPCKLSALKVQCGDVVMLSNEREGWVNKPFEVTSFVLVPYQDDIGKPAIGVDLVLRETAAGVWDWADGEDTTVDLAPDTTLHNPFNIDPPTSLTLLTDATTAFTQPDGTIVPRLKVSWASPNDQYVLSGGFIRVQYKKSADAMWLEWSKLAGDVTEEFITDVQADVNYDVRIRSETGRGAVSVWVTQTGYTVSGDLTPPDVISGLTATALSEGVRLTWTLPDLTVAPNLDLAELEVYESSSTTAPLAGTAPTFKAGKVNTYTRNGLTAGVAKYYWVRTVDFSRNKSAWVGYQTATPLAGAGTAAADAATALAQSNAAITAANGKNRNFFQTSAPSSGMIVNDNWFDTDDDYKSYQWNGSAWVAAFQPMLTLDANNNVTGLVKANGTTRDWVMVANKFQIWDGVSPFVPFEIVSGVVKIKDALIQNLDVGKLTAGNITVALNLTTGSMKSGTNASEVTMDSSGFKVGASGYGQVRVMSYDGSSAGVLLYNSAGSGKGFFVHSAGSTTLDGGGPGGTANAVQNFAYGNFQYLRAFNSSNPRTSDAPLKTDGGAWIGADLDVRGVAYMLSYADAGSGYKVGGSAVVGSRKASVSAPSGGFYDTATSGDFAGSDTFNMGVFVTDRNIIVAAINNHALRIQDIINRLKVSGGHGLISD